MVSRIAWFAIRILNLAASPLNTSDVPAICVNSSGISDAAVTGSTFGCGASCVTVAAGLPATRLGCASHHVRLANVISVAAAIAHGSMLVDFGGEAAFSAVAGAGFAAGRSVTIRRAP